MWSRIKTIQFIHKKCRLLLTNSYDGWRRRGGGATMLYDLQGRYPSPAAVNSVTASTRVMLLPLTLIHQLKNKAQAAFCIGFYLRVDRYVDIMVPGEDESEGLHHSGRGGGGTVQGQGFSHMKSMSLQIILIDSAGCRGSWVGRHREMC